jgi:hypothetical protein
MSFNVFEEVLSTIPHMLALFYGVAGYNVRRNYDRVLWSFGQLGRSDGHI